MVFPHGRDWGEAMCEWSAKKLSSSTLPELPAEYLQVRWYAVQTGVNQERQVTSRLREKDIESFLPEYEVLRRRTDRKVRLHVPLFAGYVFVHIALRDRIQVLEVPRVVRLVGFDHAPVPIADREIDLLKAGLVHRRMMPHGDLQLGRRVRVVSGPFEGVEGILLRRRGSMRVVVAIEAIARSFSLEVDERDLDRCLMTDNPKAVINVRTQSCALRC